MAPPGGRRRTGSFLHSSNAVTQRLTGGVKVVMKRPGVGALCSFLKGTTKKTKRERRDNNKKCDVICLPFMINSEAAARSRRLTAHFDFVFTCVITGVCRAPLFLLKLEKSYFFLSDVSDSGGIPTTMTVPFSTSLGAAMMRGSILQRLFLVL